MTGRGRVVPRYMQAAAIVRAQVREGVLKAGQLAPSSADLTLATGFAPLTCRKGLQQLIAEGLLVPGLGPGARPRVAGADDHSAVAQAVRALSAALARHRIAAGLTQLELGVLVGKSVTSVGHAEQGRLWQARQFWELADKALNVGGELIRRHDLYLAAESASGTPAPAIVSVVLISDNGTAVTVSPDDARERLCI